MSDSKGSGSDGIWPGFNVTPSRRAVLGGAVGALTLSATGAAPALAAATAPAGGSGEPGVETPLFKVTEFVIKRPELSKEAFIQHWRETRAPMIRALPGLVKVNFYAVDKSLDANMGVVKDIPYDAAIQTYYKDEDAYHRAFDADPQLTGRLRADAEKWIRDEFKGMFTRELVFRDLAPGAPPPTARRMGLTSRGNSLSLAEFFRTWREMGVGVSNLPKLRYYALNLVRQDQYSSSRWDGYAELAWDNLADLKAAAGVAVRSDTWRANPFGAHMRMVFTGVAEH
jgi:hypothetical protein